jgi:Domain of unknown function (DUF4124)
MKPEGSRRLPSACLGAALALAGFDAPAQPVISSGPAIYSCTDDDGRTITSDRPIQACARRPMRELNPDGSLRRTIQPPLTKEQEHEQAAREKQRQEALWARRVQQARDRNLLLMFEDEGALESMRRRGLADIDHEIRLATQRILSLDKELKLAQDAAEEWKRANPRKQLPFTFQQRITDAANSILAEDALVRDRNAERERVNSRFDADARRLRELLGNPAVSQERTRSPNG